MGDGSTVAHNVNASSFSVGSVTENETYDSTNIGTQQVDGFGTFNLTIDNFDGFGNAASSVSFTITNLGGTRSFPSDALVGNSGGNDAAAHIFVESANCTDEHGALVACATGYAANRSQVPEPGTLSLLGTGLLSLAGLLRRRMKEQRMS